MDRRALRASLLGVALTLSLAACGGSTDVNDGADAESSIGPGSALVLYLVIPVVIFAVIAAGVVLPGMVRGNRYRPAEGWDAPPVWFAGPEDAVQAVEGAEPGDVVRGGARGSW